ncbi:PfkB family carbohydrate kinase [[Mycobacterium] nativiensis]|uniref:Ribokinase n=1 Tax=[Mycobacterium] nativiensis TaxID=2855503 RepID=A0ABU5Y3T8_9MYCO|nr:PfkB family carbohydrate kinase [Mycolicibacter sp. MYC340]MEB3034861.1 PfkB family carbohydrate kinase [Mycolicibacter sp. MYC340]
MQKKHDICVVGSANMDTVLTVTALPDPGETVLATAVATTPGGKGANQAVAAARAGARVQFIGAVGDDDAGARLRRHLEANGVGTDGLKTVPGPSGSAVITVDPNGQNTIVVTPGANASLTVDLDRRDLITGAQVVLMQLEIPLATATTAARLARAGAATVIANISPIGGDLAELAGLIDVAVVNETESARFDHPVPHRVVTLGARGARYTGPDGTVHVPVPVVDAVDTSGAGDVFAGVLAAEWPYGIAHALRAACAAGALATLTPGAGDCAPSAETIRAAVSTL